MTFINFAQGDHLDYKPVTQRCRFERRQGKRTEWRAILTQEHFIFTDAEFQKLVTKGEITYYPRRNPPDEAEAKVSRIHGRRPASADDREEAARKLRYVLAVHRHAEKRRADGKKTSIVESIIAAAIDEVYEDEGRYWLRLRGSRKGRPVSKPSVKSVRRWVEKAGLRPTLRALIPGHRFKGNFDDRIHTDVRTIISTLVETDFMRRPAISIETLQVLVHTAVKKHNEEAGTEHPLPGLSAIQTSIDEWPRDVMLNARYGPMAAFIRYGSAEAQADPEHPLDRIELDSTVADLFVVCERTGLPLGRPTIVLVSDRCTRMPLAWLVTFEKPSILTVLQALRMAMLSKDWIDDRVANDGWDIKNQCVTYGIPRVLVVDRGLENISEHIAEYAVRVGINQVHIMGGKKPWLKGHVEASIRVVSERVLHPAPGTSFHNSLMRMDYRPEKDAVITLDTLNYALTKYFVDIHPYLPRRSLNNRRSIDVWLKKTRQHPVDIVADVTELDHMTGLTYRAVPGRHGLNCESMQYFSRELLEMRADPAFANALKDQGGTLELYLDPVEMGRIRVRLPHRDETITVPVAPKWRDYATGLSLFAHRTIRRFNAEESRQANADIDLLASKVRLIEIMRGEFLNRHTIKVGQRLARIEGVGRVGPSGSRSATTVEGSPANQFDPTRRPVLPTASNDGPEFEQREDAARDVETFHRAAPTPVRAKKGFRS